MYTKDIHTEQSVSWDIGIQLKRTHSRGRKQKWYKALDAAVATNQPWPCVCRCSEQSLGRRALFCWLRHQLQRASWESIEAGRLQSLLGAVEPPPQVVSAGLAVKYGPGISRVMKRHWVQSLLCDVTWCHVMSWSSDSLWCDVAAVVYSDVLRNVMDWAKLWWLPCTVWQKWCQMMSWNILQCDGCCYSCSMTSCHVKHVMWCKIMWCAVTACYVMWCHMERLTEGTRSAPRSVALAAESSLHLWQWECRAHTLLGWHRKQGGPPPTDWRCAAFQWWAYHNERTAAQ